MSTLFLIFMFLFGISFGSFVSMASYRLIHGGSFLGRSKCPKCQHTLSVADLFPILSYIYQLGKCRYCAQKISARYPLIEFTTGILFILVGYVTKFDLPNLIILSSFAICIMIMIATDFEEYIIPDSIQICLAVLGIFYAFFNHYPLINVLIVPSIMIALALALKYGFKFFVKRDGLGDGDVKFFAVSGLYLPLESISAFLLLSGLAGILTAIIWRILKKGEIFPFGPSLAIALLTCLLYPSAVNIANFLTR